MLKDRVVEEWKFSYRQVVGHVLFVGRR